MTPSKTKLSFCHSVIEQLQLQNDRMTVLYSIHTLDVYSISCLLACNCAIIDAQNFVSRRNCVKESIC